MTDRRIQTLIDLGTDAVLHLLREHFEICRDHCTSSEKCHLLIQVECLPQHILQNIQKRFMHLIRNLYSKSSPTFYTRIMELLVLKATNTICLTRDCRCDEGALKLDDLRGNLSIRLLRCDCSRCCQSELIKSLINTDEIHRRIFQYSYSFGPNITQLHISKLSYLFVDFLGNMPNLRLLHVSLDNPDASSVHDLALHLFLRLIMSNQSLEDFSLQTNFLTQIVDFPQSTVLLLRKLRALKHLYLGIESVSTDLAVNLITSLPLLQSFGINNWHNSSPFAEVFTWITVIEAKDWPKDLIWKAPIDINKTPSNTLQEIVDLSKLKRGDSEIADLVDGTCDIEGNLGLCRKVHISSPSLVKVTNFAKLHGPLLTSVSLVQRNSTLDTIYIYDLIICCSNLKDLYVVAMDFVEKDRDGMPEVELENVCFSKLDIRVTYGSSRLVLDIVHYIARSSPNLTAITLFTDEVIVRSRDMDLLFQDLGPFFKSLYLRGSRIDITNQCMMDMARACPMLESIGDVNSWGVLPQVWLWFNRLYTERQNFVYLQCSNRNGSNDQVLRVN